MTIKHDHATCDGCSPSGRPAITSITSEWFEQWERIEMKSGGEAHLCPRCEERRDRGWLAEEYVLGVYPLRPKHNRQPRAEALAWGARTAGVRHAVRLTLCRVL
jgi:hypothetical protein